MVEDKDLVRSEAAAMTDEEILDQFERRDWDDTKEILAEDIAERLALRIEDDA